MKSIPELTDILQELCPYNYGPWDGPYWSWAVDEGIVTDDEMDAFWDYCFYYGIVPFPYDWKV